MQRVYLGVIGMAVLAVQVGWADAGTPVTVSSDGWTVSGDGQQGVISITYENLGTVLKDVRLNLRGQHGLQQLKGWSVGKVGEKGLSIHTAEPRTVWAIKLGPEALTISTTTAEGVLTGEAPASKDRVVARLMDPQGVPVTWVGTNAGSGWGASETRNPSFLPSRNPECMYFGLGQVSSSNLHSLFDRPSDTAISFSDQTSMQRNRRDLDRLDVTIPVPGNALIRILPDYFRKVLGAPFYVPFDDSYFPIPPMAWGSWSSYYEDVTEQDMVRNTDWIAKNLKPYGLDYILLDDGYDRGEKGEHDWIAKWDPAKFPHGPRWLAEYIKSKGLHAGLWIVPNAYAGAVNEHPDWYLRDKQGKFILDYETPTLDHTNPEVLAFLKTLFTTLDDWGFDYYKFDGEFSLPKYSPVVDKARLYDKTIDPAVAYRNRLKMIRETIGPKVMLEGSPEGTPLDGIGYFTTYWNGYDDYNGWQGMHSVLSSINDNAFLNHIVFYLMAGEGIDVSPWMPLEVAKEKRPRSFIKAAQDRQDFEVGFGTTLAEARTLVTYVALTGGVYSVASVMPELPEERTQLLKETLPTLPILPIDLFSRGTDMNYEKFQHTTPDDYIHNYPEVLDVMVNAPSGVYDVVAMTNWRSWPTHRELSFADKLGVDPEASYVVFDFWAQKLLGVFQGKMAVTVEPHDTRVLLIHPLVNHPQLVGTSRHITGAYSIQAMEWNRALNRLRGTSETVSGDAYTLWVYVPKGVSMSQVGARTKGNAEVPVQHELRGNSLRMTFAGQPEPVQWEVEFQASASR
jgi:hypothetical protein